MLYLLEQEVSCHYERVLGRDRPGIEQPKATERVKGVAWSGRAFPPMERFARVKLVDGVGAGIWIRLLDAPTRTEC